MSKKRDLSNSKNLSVETAHYLFTEKFRVAFSTIDKIAEFITWKQGAPGWRQELEVLKSEYDMTTVEHISAYYEGAPGDGYFSAVMESNFSNRLNGIIRRVALDTSHMVSRSMLPRDALGIATSGADPSVDIINIEHIETHDDICPKCAIKMLPVAETSMYQCDCGAEFEIKGMAFNKSQVYRTDGARLKTPRVPTIEDKHFKVWMERIQATENKTFPDDHLAKLRERFERDGIRIKTDLTYTKMRQYLQALKLTCYNEHTALLLKMFTSVSPPILTIREYEDVHMKFIQVMTIYKETEWRDKKPYYPYFIYKIIDELFPNPKDGPRRLLGYIHLQKPDTLRRKDLMYAEICRLGAKSGLGLKAKPTSVFNIP